MWESAGVCVGASEEGQVGCEPGVHAIDDKPHGAYGQAPRPTSLWCALSWCQMWPLLGSRKWILGGGRQFMAGQPRGVWQSLVLLAWQGG